jgi:preprotein translocase subunit Sec61beta
MPYFNPCSNGLMIDPTIIVYFLIFISLLTGIVVPSIDWLLKQCDQSLEEETQIPYEPPKGTGRSRQIVMLAASALFIIMLALINYKY